MGKIVVNGIYFGTLGWTALCGLMAANFPAVTALSMMWCWVMLYATVMLVSESEHTTWGMFRLGLRTALGVAVLSIPGWLLLLIAWVLPSVLK